MFERFTDRARKVMQLANQEAQRFDHEYISTEHILLGLVKEGSGIGANVLKNLDVDLRKVRLEVEKLVKIGSEMMTIGKLPHTPHTKKVIEYAIKEARDLNHNYVGTEHLLMGLLRQPDSVAAQILMNLGLKLEEVRQEIFKLLGAAAAEPITFTKGAETAIKLARDEAQQRGARFLETEHLLLAMLKQHSSLAMDALAKLGINRDQLLREIDRFVRPVGSSGNVGQNPLASEQWEQTMQHARDIAREMHHDAVGTQHLLLGLLTVPHGAAGRALQQCDALAHVAMDTVRKLCQEILRHADSGESQRT